MSQKCVYIPNKFNNENEPSPIFIELQQLTNDRDEQLNIWANISAALKSKEMREKTGLTRETTLKDAIDKLSAVDDVTKLMSVQTRVNYLNYIESDDISNIDSYDTLASLFPRYHERYDGVVPIIEENNSTGKFNIRLVESTTENVLLSNKHQSLLNLNDRLIDRVESLGFTVKGVEGIGTPGMFSPTNATTNADGLKEAIMISKGYEGIEAIPEEVAHLLTVGLKGNKLMERLTNLLGREDVLRSIVGDEQYDVFYDIYEGDMSTVIDEVIGRMVAQSLADRSGITGEPMYLANRVLDRIQSMLAKADPSDIDEDIIEAFKITDEIAERIINDDGFISIIDATKIPDSKTLFRASKSVSDLKELSEKKLKLMAKSLKLMQLKSMTGDIGKSLRARYKKVRDDYDKAKYVDSLCGFLSYMQDDCEKIISALDDVKVSIYNSNSASTRMKNIRAINSAEKTIDAYSSSVIDITKISEEDAHNMGITDDQFASLSVAASNVRILMDEIKGAIDDYKVAALCGVYEKYWGDDKRIKMGNKVETLTLKGVMESWYGDVGGLSRWVNAMADMSDPMLQMADMMYKDHAMERDKKIMVLSQRIAQAQQKYTDATGSRDTSFCYETNPDGTPTGFYKSEYDFHKFYKARKDYKMSRVEYYKNAGMSKDDAWTAANKDTAEWERNNTEKFEVTIKDANGRSRTRVQHMPLKSKYGSNSLSKLSRPQREFYDTMIEIKKEMDFLISQAYATNLFKAPQKKIDIKDQLLHGDKPGNILKRIKDNYVTNSIDDTEYGEFGLGGVDDMEETTDDNGNVAYTHVVLDIKGNPVKKVPIFYTTSLGKDMKLLDTNTSDSLLAYCAMACNYHEMNKLVDILELTASQMQDRKLIQMGGNRQMKERFKFMGDGYDGDYTLDADSSNAVNVLKHYIDVNIYGVKKNLETINAKSTQFNVGKLGDALKQYSSLVGMGYNFFSGTTNLTMGLTQTFIQSGEGNGYFTGKDVRAANKEYFSQLSSSIKDQYNDIHTNKLNLLINAFDAMEDYYGRMKDSQFNNGVMRKLVGKHSPMLFNEMGEHYLHSIAMIAVLKHTKVLKDGKETSLYDAMEVRKFNETSSDGRDYSYSDVVIPENVTNLDGSAIDVKKMMFDTRLKIQDVNHKMHGAYSDVDRGEINSRVIGRLLLQFRQWMPAFYTERFKKAQINMRANKVEEGFYRTAFKFIFGTITDVFKYKKEIGARWKSLSREEKVNMHKALKEVGLLFALSLILRFADGDDDEKDPGIVALLKYNMYRLKMELGAAAPTSPSFIDNVTTLVRSPLPCMEKTDRVMSLLKISTWFNVIESGQFEGWTEAERNLFYSIPYTRNVQRTVNTLFGDDRSIFAPYKNQ